jgi:hypothetical protein
VSVPTVLVQAIVAVGSLHHVTQHVVGAMQLGDRAVGAELEVGKDRLEFSSQMLDLEFGFRTPLRYICRSFARDGVRMFFW